MPFLLKIILAKTKSIHSYLNFYFLKKYLTVFLLFSLILSLFFTQNLRSNPYAGKKIGKIQIIGTTVYKKKFLLKKMGLFHGEEVTLAKLESAFLQIKSLYFSKGFIDFFLTKNISFSENRKFINIRLIIFEGTAFVINAIILSGLPAGINDKVNKLNFLSGLTYKKNGPYDPRKIKANEKILLEQFINLGYRNTKISSKIQRAGNALNIIFNISPGKIWYIGNLSFSGNKNIKKFVIINAVHLTKGEKYSPKKIQSSIDDLYKTELFRAIELKEIESLNSAEDKQKVTIHFNLEESKHRSIGFGAGYDNVEEWKGIIRWQTKNAFGRGALLRSDLSYSTINTEAKLTYKERNFFTKKLIVESKPFWRKKNFNEEEQINYNLEILGIENSLIYPLTKHLKISQSYDYLYNYNIKFNPGSMDIATLENQRTEEFVNSNEHILRQGLAFSTRDNFLNPSKGFYTSLRAKTHWKLSHARYNFYQINFSASLYLPILSDFILSPSAQAGIQQPMNKKEEIHLFDRFIHGEDFSLRGYPYGKFGPKRSGQFIGGDRFYFFSVELRSPFIYFFQLIIFNDWGNLLLKEWSKKQKPAITPGFGFRLKTPVGPLRLDVGFISGRKDWLGTANFSFGLGQYF